MLGEPASDQSLASMELRTSDVISFFPPVLPGRGRDAPAGLGYNQMTPEQMIDIAVKVLQSPPFEFDESQAQRFAEAFKVALAKA